MDLMYLFITCPYVYLPFSFSPSFQHYLIWSWLSLHFFHQINIFPLRVFSLSQIFSFYTLSFPSPCFLQTRSPSLHAAN